MSVDIPPEVLTPVLEFYISEREAYIRKLGDLLCSTDDPGRRAYFLRMIEEEANQLRSIRQQALEHRCLMELAE